MTRHTAESVKPGPMGPVHYFLADGVGDAGIVAGPFYSHKRANDAARSFNICEDLTIITGAHGPRAAREIADYLNRKAGDR